MIYSKDDMERVLTQIDKSLDELAKPSLEYLSKGQIVEILKRCLEGIRKTL